MIDLAESDLYIYDENFPKSDFDATELRPPWWARFMALVRLATDAIGSTPEAGPKLHDGVKNHRPFFEDIHYCEHSIPGSAWRERLGLAKER